MTTENDKPKFTPGPWRWQYIDTRWRLQSLRSGANGHGQTVIAISTHGVLGGLAVHTLWSGSARGHVVRPVNAVVDPNLCLIAAAPAMYEALVAARNTLWRIQQTGLIPYAVSYCGLDIHEIDRVLSSVQGK